MARIELTAATRATVKKSELKTMRRSGVVPGIVYHKGDESVSIQLDGKALFAALHTDAGRNVLIDLKVKNEKAKKQRTVVVKDLQHAPVNGEILHVDFHQISLTERLEVNVPIVEKGEAPGVKNDGGVLESPLRELHIECLPTEIPESIEVDISNLKLNDSIHVRDIRLGGSIKILNDADMVIVQVKLPVVEKPEETAEAATEPEVIGAKKEGEEGEEGAEKADKGEKAEKAEKPEKAEKGEGKK